MGNKPVIIGLEVSKKQQNWNTFLADVVDDVIKQIFKEDGAKVIYNFLETHAQLKLEDVANRPKVFSESIQTLMLSAANIVEQNILISLYSKLGIKFEDKKGYKFADYIQELMKE